MQEYEYPKIARKRINKEFNILRKFRKGLAENNIFFKIDQKYYGKINIMIIGPEKTPYEHGFYFFDLRFPAEYPFAPPKVIFHMNQKFNTRFNPNLYVNGKVCLSMINTWHGEGWSPTYTIDKVMLTLVAVVMTDQPLKNEPGWEKKPIEVLEQYNQCIRHDNFYISLYEVLKNKSNPDYILFSDIINEYFKNNLIKILQKIEELEIKNLKFIEFIPPCYGFKTINKYSLIKENLCILLEKSNY